MPPQTLCVSRSCWPLLSGEAKHGTLHDQRNQAVPELRFLLGSVSKQEQDSLALLFLANITHPQLMLGLPPCFYFA